MTKLKKAVPKQGPFGFTVDDCKKTVQLLKLSLRKRYMGSNLGIVWAIINPLLLMLIYVFVFGFIFPARVPGAETSLEYVVWFICGFGSWLPINEGINATANSIISNSQMIKTFPIKLELFPISNAMLGLPQLIVALVVIIILSFIVGSGISLSILWLLIIIPLMFAFLAGIGFFLSAICVFARDFLQLIPTILMFILFFTPVFYSLEQMPIIIQKVNFFNPIYQICISFRVIFIDQQHPNLWGLLYVLALTILLWFFGLKFFRRLKGYFESAL